MRDIQDEIIGEFAGPSELQKYERLIELGRRLPASSDGLRSERHALPGCQSQVWIRAYEEHGSVVFEADSDSLIIRGLLALLLRVFAGRSPEDAASADLRVFRESGLSAHLSPTRANGLSAIVLRFHELAAGLAEHAE